MLQEHIKSYYTITDCVLFIVCVILTSDPPQVRYTSTNSMGGGGLVLCVMCKNHLLAMCYVSFCSHCYVKLK